MSFPLLDMPRLVTYAVWVGFAAVSVIVGLVYGLDDPAEGAAWYDESQSESQAGEIYSALFGDIRFAKIQQWNVAYYSLLLLAAIAGLRQIPAIAGVPIVGNWILPLLADCVWGLSIISVLVFQRSQQTARIRQNQMAMLQRRSHYWMDDPVFTRWLERAGRFSLHFGWVLLFIIVVTIGWLAVEYLLLLT